MTLHHEDGRREKVVPWVSTSGMRLLAVTVEKEDIERFYAYAPHKGHELDFGRYFQEQFLTRLVA